MYPMHYCLANVLGKIIFLALLGFGALFVVLLAFKASILILLCVLIGAFVYVPYLLVRGLLGLLRCHAPSQMRRPPVAVVRVVEQVEQPVMPLPARHCRGVGAVRRVIAEVLCGAIVGGVLGSLAAGRETTEFFFKFGFGRGFDYIVPGICIGVVVGFVVGCLQSAPAERTSAIG